MEKTAHATKHHQRRGNINKLVTQQMRQQIREVKELLDDYSYDIRGYCDLLNDINEALFIARQSARCLLTNDPFGTWEKIRGQDEYDAFHGFAEKQITKRKANVEKLVTPQMRHQIIAAKKTIEDYATCLGEFIEDEREVESFGMAIELAESLHCSRPLETREMRKRREAGEE